jgi:hypothetical protein
MGVSAVRHRVGVRLFVPVDQQPVRPERVFKRSPSMIFERGVFFRML